MWYNLCGAIDLGLSAAEHLPCSRKHSTHPPATWLAKLIARADRPAGMAELMRPRMRWPMGTAQRVSKAAMARGHIGR